MDKNLYQMAIPRFTHRLLSRLGQPSAYRFEDARLDVAAWNKTPTPFPRRCFTAVVCALLLDLGCNLPGHAQDLIKRSDETSIEAQVLEVRGSQIFYKKWAEQAGPTVILGTVYVQYILYRNGTRQDFPRSAILATSLPPPPSLEKPVNLGRNMVSIMPGDLIFNNAAFAYERLFGAASRVGVKVPLTVGFGHQEPINRYQNDYQPNKIFSTGLELNFYTTPAARFRYFIGPAFQYGRFRYRYAEEYLGELDFFGWRLGKVYGSYRESVGEHFAVILNNGVWYQIGKRFVFTATGGLGWQTKVLDKTRRNLNTEDLAGARFKPAGNLSLSYQF